MGKKTIPKSVGLRPVELPKLTTEEEQLFDYDVCCSIEELENMLSKNMTEKQRKLTEVSLKILRNPEESLIKKKQVMRQQFGDYREKFDSKKKQVISKLNNNKVFFKSAEFPQRSVFYRKHVLNCSDKNTQNQKQMKSDASKKNSQNEVSSIQESDRSFKFNF